MKKKATKVLSMVCAFVMAANLVACGQAASSAPAASGTGSYTAGTYTATSNGNNGPLTVEVQFDESSIQSVAVTEHKETPAISDKAISDIPTAIVENQSLAVDAVSGATYTSIAIVEAVADCVNQAGGDAETLKNKEIEKVLSTEEITKDADVVILGGGGAGMSAAITAAQNGSKVILVEKNAYLGGNTVRTGGWMMVNWPENLKQLTMSPEQLAVVEAEANKPTDNEQVKGWQEKVKADIAEYKANGDTYFYDSPEFNALQLYFRFSESAIPERLFEMITRSKEDLDWLIDLGFPCSEVGGYCLGDNWPRWYYSTADQSGRGYIRVMEDAIKAQNLDIEIMMETEATELIANEEGRVVGTIAFAPDGTKYTLNASQGVVVATGGFAANSELVKKYSDGRWPEGFENLPTSNDPALDGVGILMGESMGAQMYDMGHLQILPTTDPANGQISSFVGNPQGLYVNKEGKRFVDETADRDTMVRAILSQTDASYYVISDRATSGLTEDNLNMFGIALDDLIARGKVVEAATLEELAEKIGVPADVLTETVKTFNESCETGHDAEFGRPTYGTNVKGLTVAVKEGPYYACLRSPARHITKGGILINGKAQVLDQNNEIIPGFYAAGEVTGGTSVAGLIHCIDQGRMAGATVSQEAK